MNDIIFTNLQIVEIFHLEFLRWFGGKIDSKYYALKGGVNLRLFFRSIRYSEDMDIDLDVKRVRVDRLVKVVMDILSSRRFLDILNSLGIEGIVLPNINIAKLTSTTQRFKVHLLTKSGADLATKIEFSGRGLKGDFVTEKVVSEALRSYKIPGFIVSHYSVNSAVLQKISALAGRNLTEARDIFDIDLLSAQYNNEDNNLPRLNTQITKVAHENVFNVSFTQFRDTVVKFLRAEDQKVYDSKSIWDEIQLRTAQLIEDYKNE